jgi:hypothetical protein
MTVSGHVRNGVIVLDEPTKLPEGAAVEVNLVAEDDGPTLLESLKPFIGVIKDMPPDMSENLDHYLYGTPKRS